MKPEIPGYRIDHLIGQGGLARVYAAHRLEKKQDVALKVVDSSSAHLSQDFLDCFILDARILAGMAHPNIVPIHDIGQTDHSAYMAMELLHGGTLKQKTGKGALTADKALNICAQLARALHALHLKNIVHGSLRPLAVLFRNDGTPLLADFGVSLRILENEQLAKTGYPARAPHYLSPEQITDSKLDGRSDLYSLGLILFQLLSGEFPFESRDPLTMAMRKVKGPPPRLPDAHSELQPVLDRMLASRPEDRYRDCSEFCRAAGFADEWILTGN